MKRETMTVPEAAKYLGITQTAVRFALHSSDSGLDGIKIKGRHLVFRDSIVSYKPRQYSKPSLSACTNCGKDDILQTIQPFFKLNRIEIDGRSPARLCVECCWVLMDTGFRAIEARNLVRTESTK